MTATGDAEQPIPHPALWGVLYRNSTPFWEAVKRHELELQRCAQCGHWLVPPRPMCPKCRSADSEWVPVSGHGTIYSWVTYHESPHPAFEVPYSVVLVELDEGVRLVSNPVDIASDELEIGMPVDVVFEDIDDDLTLFKFTRAA
ncbi:MAG: Zn-ribbon domain-containing OB-fold protein [Acidimicrobiia bacterium]|nr:Zn-ribbon domain-containing OB-fold protein [Acidimicrobiia bacterium]